MKAWFTSKELISISAISGWAAVTRESAMPSPGSLAATPGFARGPNADASTMTAKMPSSGRVRIDRWDDRDLLLLQQLVGNAEMMAHLGGPESAEKIAERQRRYEAADGMFKIVDVTSGEPCGWVGYWEREWQGAGVVEIGWAVLPRFQGRGVASSATAQALAAATSAGRYLSAHAFPAVDNQASNAICRKLGFELVQACEFEYPCGHFMRCNDWRLSLTPR